MQDQEQASPEERIRDTSCSSEYLDSMARKNARTDRLIASHPNTSADTFSKLRYSHDDQTRINVTLNPNTPRSILIDLGRYFPREFLQNPAFDLTVLGDPDCLSGFYCNTLAAILRQPECPYSIVEWASDNYSKCDGYGLEVLIAISQNPTAGVSLIERLFQIDVARDISCSEGML